MGPRRKLTSFPATVRISQGSRAERTVQLEPTRDARGPFRPVAEPSGMEDPPSGAFSLGDSSPSSGLPCKKDRSGRLFQKSTSRSPFPLISPLSAPTLRFRGKGSSTAHSAHLAHILTIWLSSSSSTIFPPRGPDPKLPRSYLTPQQDSPSA